MVEMQLIRIVIHETGDEQVIVLKEKNGERSFPIVIGIFEAAAIDRKIKKIRTPRPMTHDLLENAIRGLSASLERIVVTELRDSTFFAKLVLKSNGKIAEIDSRPSDAIALATQWGAPIFVAEEVLDSVATE